MQPPMYYLAMDLGLKSSVGWVPLILYEPSQEEVIKKYHTSTLDVFYRVSEYELYYRFETFSHFPFNKWILLEFESIFSAFSAIKYSQQCDVSSNCQNC